MKITILALHLGFGGVEKYVVAIANILCEKYTVEIISTYQMLDKPAFSLSDKVKVTYLITGMKQNKEQFKKAIKHKNPLKIFREGLYSIKLLYLKNKKNKEAISNCKSDVIISTRDYHNEMIQKYANKNIIKITTEHNHPCGNQKYIKRFIKSCKGFDYLLPISKELSEFYRERLYGTTIKVLYIPFYIDAPTCVVQPNFEHPVFINVGRLSSEKGTLDLIKVFKKITNKEPNALLHLVGDGELMEKIKNLIHELGLNNHIIIHGFLEKNDIEALYAESSIFLMTSYTESFGFVLLEAMASGLPCIAFDSAQGAKEIIKDNNNGYLIPDRNTDLYVKKSCQLYKNKNLLVQMSKNAKQCLQMYSYEKTKQQWINLMNDIKVN